MKAILSYFKGLSVLALCVATTIGSMFANAREPWWTNPQLEWKPFTALPMVDNPNNSQWYWNIQERNKNGIPKFFAQSILWGSPGRFLLANASITPSFNEPVTNLSFGIANSHGSSITAYPTSSAMARWNKSYDEFFIGNANGIWRFDEDLGYYVNEWYWYWDATYIASLGNALFGSVVYNGTESGNHIWRPGMHTNLDPYHSSGTSSIWADPVSGRYGWGAGGTRVLSTGISVLILSWASTTKYSFDGGITYVPSVGTRTDGHSFSVVDFYEYSGTNMIFQVNSLQGGEDLFIGPLGGTLYPIPFPTNTYVSTFFYSPSTRLLVAGDARTDTLYYAVLPPPDGGPQLDIQSAFILSWSTNYPLTVLESTTNLTTGAWSAVDAPYNIVGEKIQVAVPKEQQMFFRLNQPE